jgi:hypothetical protein
MKTSFPGHFRLDEATINNLWKTCIFAIDANILLNLYRYSDSTREELLKILHSLRDRLWIPHQAALEYLRDRLGVIGQQEKTYEGMLRTLEDALKRFKDSRQHPFISQNLLAEFSSVLNKVKDELTSNRKQHIDRISSDAVLDQVGSLLEGRVGSDMSSEEKAKIIPDAKDRYLRKVPPGYRDAGKDKSDNDFEDIGRFGDFIIWKQIIDKAGSSKSGIIFVTDDRKDDWWLISSGKTVGPLPELIQEFRRESEQLFYMYQPDRFMEFAVEYLQQQVGGDAIKEVRELREKKEEELEELTKLTQTHLERAKARLMLEGAESDRRQTHRRLHREQSALNDLLTQQEFAARELSRMTPLFNELLQDEQDGETNQRRRQEVKHVVEDAQHRVNSLFDRIAQSRHVIEKLQQQIAELDKMLISYKSQ